MQKLTVRWNLNNWTNQGPGSICVHCTVDAQGFTGFDERRGHGTNSGAGDIYNTFDKFMELLDLCRDCMKRIKAGPQDAYSRVRESIDLYEVKEDRSWVYFLEYGSTSPRHRFDDKQDDKGIVLVRMVIDYIENINEKDTPLKEMLRDAIIDQFHPVKEG